MLFSHVGLQGSVTAPLAWYECGSSAWSAESLVGRESNVARNDLAKKSSVILPILSPSKVTCRSKLN